MKAFCLQLSVVLCTILSISTLTSQSLQITCPSAEERFVTCIDDVPAQSGDSLGFLTYDGALIEGVTGPLVINYSNFVDPNRGCPGNVQRVIRSFEFSDDSQTPSIMCNIRYIVVQENNVDAISCDDITINVDDVGEAILEASSVTVTPTLQCPGDLTILDVDNSFYSCEDIGESPILNSLTALSECGEELTCEFEVTIVDSEDPIIDCPGNIVVSTPPCVCEAVVTFAEPESDDNCGLRITRLDSTGLESGDLFPGGLTVLTFQAEDEGGNQSSCNLQVRINSGDPGSIACKGNQNISLDENCTGVISPGMVVDEALCDIESYRITLFDRFGVQLPSDTITGEYLGTVVTARASYECFENSCSLSFTVEDKMPPMMNCRDTMISCSELIEFPLPEISDNCSTFEVLLLNQKLEDVSCESATIDKIITRTYGIRDEDGTIMESCDQNLLIRKFDISEVVGPELMVLVDCGSDFETDENGHPDPSVTGAPSLDGIDLFPQSEILCNVGLSYDDMELTGGTQCGSNLIRTWTVVNWYCSEDGMATFKQSIAVLDTTDPVLILPEDITISSASSSCETTYTIPEPGMSDDCQSDLQLDIFYPGGVEFDTNSIEVALPLGDNLIQYRLNDQCGNMTLQSYTVTVEDNIEPVAICESGMSFSLDGNGSAILTAQTFDNGSLDACSDALLEISRMGSLCGNDQDTIFGASITLCCSDIGTELMVALRVTDDAGNSNSCMTSIQVIDEISPFFLTDLPDITVSNDFAIDTADLSVFGSIEQNVDFPMDIDIDANEVLFSGPNVNAVVMDNCSVNQVVEQKFADINMCQTGEILRTFIVSDDSGTADTIQQRIEVIAERTFSAEDIRFPNDTIINECNPNLDPQTISSFPIYDEGFNSMVSYTKEDDTISAAVDGCYTLERIWFVSDWCNRPDGSTFATYIDTQLITIVDNINPEITSACLDSTLCSFVSGCGPHPVNISASGSDNCTLEDSLKWTFRIDFADELPDSIGTGNNFNGLLPVGENQITWTLDDGCGNTTECTYTFTIENCITPQPICLLSQEFFIATIDTSDNDDDSDAVNLARIAARQVDAGSKHPCGKEVVVAFSEDRSDTVRYFECDDLGSQQLMLYAIDEDGNFDFCNLAVNIRDTTSSMLCGMGMVAGVVYGNDIDFVKDVNVTLEGSGLQTMTDENGFFFFPEMTTGGKYSVYPTKEDRALNGVSTSDIVMIQRHILGIEVFESPYKRIAADVNRSANVSASDIILIRKLLLGLVDEFPEGQTWTFVPGDHIFLDPKNPWASVIPDKHDIYYLNGQPEINFIGIKLGDVNESAALRSDVPLQYHVEGTRLTVIAGEDIEFAGLFNEVYLGDYDLKINAIENHSHHLVENHALKEGTLRLLLTDAYNERFLAGDEIFTLEMDRMITARDLESIRFNNLNSEMVLENGSSASIQFRNLSTNLGVVIGQNEPNPWTEQTSFEISMPHRDIGNLRIMDLSGKVVYNAKLDLNEGNNTITVDHTDISGSGGMYIYEVSSSYGIVSKKMMLIRN